MTNLRDRVSIRSGTVSCRVWIGFRTVSTQRQRQRQKQRQRLGLYAQSEIPLCGFHLNWLLKMELNDSSENPSPISIKGGGHHFSVTIQNATGPEQINAHPQFRAWGCVGKTVTIPRGPILLAAFEKPDRRGSSLFINGKILGE